MSLDIRERAHWLARNVLPHEPLIRARLRKVYVAGLDIDDVIQEMYARILSVPNMDSIRYPKQYAIQTAKAIIIDHLRRSQVIAIDSCGSLDQLDAALPETSVEERLEFRDEIQEVLSQMGNENELALFAARKYASRLNIEDWKQFREKLGAFLGRRGFSYEIISETVNDVWKELQPSQKIDKN